MGKDRKKEKIMFWVFMAPALLAFLMVQVVPFFLGLYYSFTNWTASAQSSIDIVGIKNYVDAFADTTFLYSTIITTIYTLLNIIMVNIIAFCLALLVTSAIHVPEKTMTNSGTSSSLPAQECHLSTPRPRIWLKS